jgi:hypothetical protein
LFLVVVACNPLHRPAAVSLRLKSLRDKGVKVPELASTRSSNVAEDAMDILAELGIEQDTTATDTE